MTRLTKDLILVGLGGLIGAGITTLYYRAHFNDEVNKEVKESRDFARLRIAEYQQRAEIAEQALEKLEATTYEEPDDEINPEDEAENPYEDAVDRISRGDYSPSPTEANRDIYLISEEEYDSPEPPNKKVVLLHYQLDDTLSTDDDELIDDPVALVGDCLDHMAVNGPWKICYIRNNAVGIDYEVDNIIGTFPTD